jgi:hypothetical protein
VRRIRSAAWSEVSHGDDLTVELGDEHGAAGLGERLAM